MHYYPYCYNCYLNSLAFQTMHRQLPIPGLFPTGQPPMVPPGQFPGYYPTPVTPMYPGSNPGQMPQQSAGQGAAPTTQPPSYIPQKPPQAYAIDAPSMFGCIYKWTYVWLSNGNQMWFFPTFIGPTSVAGYVWPPGSPLPSYFGIDAKQIDAFNCNF